MMWTPFGDLLMFDFVKAAIEGENLGNNPAGVPDIRPPLVLVQISLATSSG
jgi:hypothetical protein